MIRSRPPSAGLWWGLFTLIPVIGLRSLPPRALDGLQARATVRTNPVRQLANTFADLRNYPQTLLFLAAYLFYNELGAAGYAIELATIALVHTIGAFMMLAFLIGHIYLGTTGHTPTAHFKAIFTGWDEAH